MRPGRVWSRMRLAWVVLAMCVLSWVAPGPAAAATGWQLTANPTTVLAGQPTTIELRLVDTDGSGDIACARIFIGAQFEVLGVGVRGTSAPSPWAAAQAGAAPTTVSVWNPDGNGKLKGGDWVDLYLTVNGNSPGSHAWTANALQNNDCTGDPFLEPISPVITVTSPAPPAPAPTPVPPPPPPPPPAAAEPIAPPAAATVAPSSAAARPADAPSASGAGATAPSQGSPAPTFGFTSPAGDLGATGADSEPGATSEVLAGIGDVAIASADTGGSVSSARASEAGAGTASAGMFGLLLAVVAILGGMGILWAIIWRRRRRKHRSEEDAVPSVEGDRAPAGARTPLGVGGESVDPILAAMGLGRSDPE